MEFIEAYMRISNLGVAIIGLLGVLITGLVVIMHDVESHKKKVVASRVSVTLVILLIATILIGIANIFQIIVNIDSFLVGIVIGGVVACTINGAVHVYQMIQNT